MNLAAVIRSEQKLLLPTYDRQKVLFTADAAFICGIHGASATSIS